MGNRGGFVVSQWGRWGKASVQNFLQPFLENIDRRSLFDGNWELIPVFHNPHRKFRLSPSAVACTLEYLAEVPSLAVSSEGNYVFCDDLHPGEVQLVCNKNRKCI